MNDCTERWRRLSDKQWLQRLGAERFRICRQRGTEPPGSGDCLHEQRAGRYACAGCGQVLFVSASKFDSGSGWPSFFAPASDTALEQHTDRSHGMQRIEVRCSCCGSHLGHLFSDGPQPTGLRYCINALALEFLPA